MIYSVLLTKTLCVSDKCIEYISAFAGTSPPVDHWNNEIPLAGLFIVPLVTYMQETNKTLMKKLLHSTT